MRAFARSLGMYVPGRGFGDLRDFIPAGASPLALTAMAPNLGDFIPAGPSPLALTSLAPNLGDFVGTLAMYPIVPNSVTAGAAQMTYEGGLIDPSLTYAGGVTEGLSGVHGRFAVGLRLWMRGILRRGHGRSQPI